MANKKKTPGINASSMADIAFLLLIFWLTTTTMNSDKGLQRRLPPMPEKEMKQIEGFGEYPVSKGVVSLQNDRGTSYNAYLQVQNELAKAFNEVRDDFARQNFGTVYNNLDEDKQKIVREAIPLSISEAEPKDVGRSARR